MLVKMGWSTHPAAVRGLSTARTILGVAPFVPFQFQPDALFWLVASRAAREEPGFLKPAYRDLHGPAEADGPTTVRFLAQVAAVVAEFPRGSATRAAAEALGDDLIWTPEWLLAQAEASGRGLYVFALIVHDSQQTHTLERVITTSGQLGLRAIEAGTPRPLLPPPDVQSRAQAIAARVSAVSGAPASRPHAPSSRPTARQPQPGQPRPAAAEPGRSHPPAEPAPAPQPRVDADRIQAENLRLRHERDQLAAQVEDLRRQVTSLQEELAALTREHMQALREKAELEQELEDLHAEAAERDAALEEAEARVADLRQRIERGRAPRQESRG